MKRYFFVGKEISPSINKQSQELGAMKKDELIAFGQEGGIDMTAIAEKTKAEIIEFLVNASKE